jgi:hypothetical protein
MFGGLAVVVAVGIAIELPQEPRYQGRSLSQWLSVFTATPPEDPLSPASISATDAVRHIGPKATPYLLSYLRPERGPSKARELLGACLDALPPATIPGSVRDWIDEDDASLQYERAAMGFYLLGKSAAPAIPELFRLATNQTQVPRARWATIALGNIGPEALPQLLQIVTNRNAPARYEAIAVLSEFGSNALPAVSAIIQCINDPEDDVSYGATVVLGTNPRRTQRSRP